MARILRARPAAAACEPAPQGAGLSGILTPMQNRWLVPFLNLGHLLDHLAMLVFPTAVLAIGREWGRPYSELLPLALGSFVAFGAFAIPAGWLADRWSRYRVMLLFFFGVGTSLVLTGLASSGWQLAAGLTVMGAFAAIYHPVGIAMLVARPEKMGRVLGWNGLWGNLGLAFAALLTGALVDGFGWRAAFFVPGALCVAAGVGFLLLVRDPGAVKRGAKSLGLHVDARMMTRIFAVLLVATACGGVIFNSTTIAMPKVFDERLRALTETSLGIGALVAFVYTLAAFAQVMMGALIDRTELRRLMIGVSLAQIPLLYAAASLEGWAMLAAAVLMMLAVFGQIPLNDAIVGRYVADEFRARVLGVRYVVSLGVAAVAVPMIAVLHRTEGGFANVFLVLSLLAAGMLAASLFFPARAELLAQREKLAAMPRREGATVR
jgi:MFS family permease